MLTVAEIEKWRIARGLTCKELAEQIGANYFHLAAVLRGERPLSTKMEAAIQGVMTAEPEGLKVAIAPQYEELLRTWANTAGMSVDQLVHELLTEAMHMKSRRPQAPPFSRQDGLLAADDDADSQ